MYIIVYRLYFSVLGFLAFELGNHVLSKHGVYVKVTNTLLILVTLLLEEL